MCAVFAVHADPLLYWMVDQEGTDNISFDVARLAYSTDGGATAAGYLTLVDEQGGTAQAIAGSGGDTAATWADFAGLANYSDSGYTFFIELLSYNGGWERMGQSAAASYSDLVSNGSVLASSLSVGTMAMTAWTPTVSIPEPSGALLFLMGGSLLALRRRRKTA